MSGVVEQLKYLGLRGILITAAEKGLISEVKCKMDECLCPRGDDYFEKRPKAVSDWAPSVDHINLKSKGGQLTLDNIRLAHVLCNRVDYAKKHGVKHDKDLARAVGGTFAETDSDQDRMTFLAAKLQEVSTQVPQDPNNPREEEFVRGWHAAMAAALTTINELV
jgi:hypothetical protein